MTTSAGTSPLVIECYADGGLVLCDDDRREAAPTTVVVHSAADAAERGRPVEVRGAVRKRINKPVVDAIRHVCPGVTSRRHRAPHPEGWLMLDVAVEHPEVWDDLIQRGRTSGSLDRLLRLAVRFCRVDAVRALRDELDRSSPAGPAGAGPDAVTLEPSKRTERWIIVGFMAIAAVLLYFSADFGSARGWFAAGATVVAFGAAAWIGSVSRRQRVCADGPNLWSQRRTGRWRGPIDLRRLVACDEHSIKGHLTVLLYQRAPTGSAGPTHGRSRLDRATIDRLRGLAPFDVLGVRIDNAYLLPGFGRHVMRFADPDVCVFVEQGSVRKHMNQGVAQPTE